MLGLVQPGAAGGVARVLVRSSVGKKLLVAATGLGLCGFLVAHLWGNLLLYVGPEAFNNYAAFLEQSSLLIPAEIALAAMFFVHMGFALTATYQNWRARPERYARAESKGAATVASSTMFITGSLVFAFLIMHLINFKFAARDPVTPDGGGLYGVVVTHFESFFAVALYVMAMGLIGLHVSHGLQSALRTVGLAHDRYTPAIEKASVAFGAIIALGFLSIPIWAFVARP